MFSQTAFQIVLLLALGSLIAAAPIGPSDLDENGLNTGSLFNAGHPNYLNGVDYHTVVGHFKDFLMYLPVMMTTVKDTMTGFPKFAEGLRVLVSGPGHLDTDDCKCRGTSSNEVDSTSGTNNGNSISRYG